MRVMKPHRDGPVRLVCLVCLVCMVINVAGCAATAGPPPATGPGAQAGATAGARQGGAAPAEEKKTPEQESLFELVPASARAVVILRRNLLAQPTGWINRPAKMRRELSRFLRRTVGVDLTRVEGVVGYALRLDPRPAFAVLLRLRDGAGASLKGPRAGQHRGVPLVKVADAPGGRVVAAVLAEGVALGTVDGVEAAIDLSLKRRPAIDGRARLGDVLQLDGRRVNALVGLDASGVRQAAPLVRRFGVGVAAMTLDHDGEVVLRVTGDADKLKLALSLIRATMSAALAKLEQKMRLAASGSDVPAGVAGIVTFYQAREILAELGPQFDGAGLVSRYRLPKLDLSAGFVAYSGVLAAVAIPAFIKYIRKSKTVEATESLDKIKAGLVAHHRGYSGNRRRYRFPDSTPWTPARSCCKGAGAPRCRPDAAAFNHPTWKAVRFALQDPHHYQYRISSEGRGRRARVTIEARGDLDCDGVLSSYRLIGSFEADGTLVFKGPIISNEIE